MPTEPAPPVVTLQDFRDLQDALYSIYADHRNATALRKCYTVEWAADQIANGMSMEDPEVVKVTRAVQAWLARGRTKPEPFVCPW